MLDEALIRDFVLAGHFDLAKVQSLLGEHPDLLNARHNWGNGDWESALQAAGHVGNRAIAEYLLAQGAPLEIGVAAMLGLRDEVERLLIADPALANASIVHGLKTLFHVAISGDVELAEMLVRFGCHTDFNQALHGAVGWGNLPMAIWLLDHGVTDLNTKNFRGMTPLKQAQAQTMPEMASLLESRGARAEV